MLDEATVVRWILWGTAAGAIVWGLWHFLKRDPPGRTPSVLTPARR